MFTPTHIPAAALHDCLPTIAAGMSGAPELLVTGGATANAAKIVVTNNFLANDTFTFDGVVFTCKASGAAGELEFNVGGSLSLSLDALITALNACTNPLVSSHTYTKTDTATAVTATPDAMGAAGNMVVASNHSTVVLTQGVGGSDVNTASMDTEHTKISISTGLTQQINIPVGSDTQQKTFTSVGLGTAELKVPNAAFFGATVKWSLPAGASVGLFYTNGKWAPTFNNGATAS
jgi:hypothetical protein